MIQELSKKGIVLLTYLFNAALRLRYVPKAWKRAKMIVILKPDKPADLVTSYRPISLLSIISKILEKIVLARLQPIVESKQLLPSIQFGFRLQTRLHRTSTSCCPLHLAIPRKQTVFTGSFPRRQQCL